MSIHDTNGQFVSKNWIITALVGLVCFFGGIGITTVLADTKELKVRQQALEDLSDKRMDAVEARVLVIETQYSYIVKMLDEIRREVKK